VFHPASLGGVARNLIEKFFSRAFIHHLISYARTFERVSLPHPWGGRGLLSLKKIALLT